MKYYIIDNHNYDRIHKTPVAKKNVAEDEEIFFSAPTYDELTKHIKKINGPCVGLHPTINLEPSVRSVFTVGDPLQFEGVGSVIDGEGFGTQRDIFMITIRWKAEDFMQVAIFQDKVQSVPLDEHEMRLFHIKQLVDLVPYGLDKRGTRGRKAYFA